MITNWIYEHPNILSLWFVSFLVGLRTYQHSCYYTIIRDVGFKIPHLLSVGSQCWTVRVIWHYVISCIRILRSRLLLYMPAPIQLVPKKDKPNLRTAIPPPF